MNTVSCFVKRHRFSVLAVIALSCSTVYLGTGMLGVTFLSDDIGLITWGKQATGPGFWKPWTGNRLTGEAGSPRYFRPLTLLSHGLDAALWGWTPSGHRLTNLILHFLNSLLVFALVRALLPEKRPVLAFWTALSFALHPVHETAVWWIACRMELLCAFFYLMCLLLFEEFLKKRKRVWLCASVLSAALALASKEMAYTLPVTCFGLGLLKAHGASPFRRLGTAAVRAFPVGLVATGFLLLRLTEMPVGATLFALEVTPAHAVTVVRLAIRYLAFPFHVSLRQTWNEHPFILLTGLLALTGLLWPLRRRVFSWPVALGIAWIASTAILLMRTMSPWSLYLPSAGFCLVLSAIAEPGTKWREWSAAALTLGVLTAYMVQWDARKDTWQEVDNVTRSFINDVRAIAIDEGVNDPVIVCAPGAVGTIPTLLHYFDMRMRHETGQKDFNATVLTFVMVPAEPEVRSIRMEQSADLSWLVTPAEASTTFLFPEKDYEFQQYPSGTSIEAPWGLLTLRGANTTEESTALEVRLTHDAVSQWRTRKWYGFDGRRLVALAPDARP